MEVGEKVEITDEHINAIREKWDCAGMNDDTIIKAMLRYEKRYAAGAVTLIEMICFPDFQAYLTFYKNKTN